VSVEILRILQEALNNVRKHADAIHVTVRVEQNRRSVMLTVHDDGIGFDTALPSDGYGRRSMDERAKSINGRLRISSIPGRGTTVTLRVPVTPPARRP
jgi:signal transduction histidine kinase